MKRNPTIVNKPDITHQEVFSQFFQQSHLQVYRYIYGLTGGPAAEVEDLTAESFARAWSARANFHGDFKEALFWTLKIAKHQVIDAYRRRKTTHEPDSLETFDPPTREAAPEDQIISHERSVILWGLLLTLPESPREMLVLRYMLDWTVGGIAQYVHKNETAVSMAIHRALKQLQQNWPINEPVLEPGSVIND